MTLPILLAVIATNIAPDGVNTINREDGQAALGVIPDEFRSGSPQTVIIPGADTSYVVMSEAWYASLTNRLAATERDVAIVRADAEKTESGRVKFHGQRVRVSENKDELRRVHFYADGWSFSESYRPRKANTPTGSAAPSSATSSKDAGTSEASEASSRRYANPRYAAALRRREAAKNAKPIEKTVIHIGGHQ